MSTPNPAIATPVQVNKIQLPNGTFAVQLIVESGLLAMAFTLDSKNARTIGRALRDQAEACDKAIVLAHGPLPATAGN